MSRWMAYLVALGVLGLTGCRDRILREVAWDEPKVSTEKVGLDAQVPIEKHKPMPPIPRPDVKPMAPPSVAPEGESPAPWQGEVVGVTDGTTVEVLRDGKRETVRLSGVECPKQTEVFGLRSQELARSLAVGETVTIETVEVDPRTRQAIARVKLRDGRSLGEELVRRGYAWCEDSSARDADTKGLRTLEEQARQRGFGVWATPATAPSARSGTAIGGSSGTAPGSTEIRLSPPPSSRSARRDRSAGTTPAIRKLGTSSGGLRALRETP